MLRKTLMFSRIRALVRFQVGLLHQNKKSLQIMIVGTFYLIWPFWRNVSGYTYYRIRSGFTGFQHPSISVFIVYDFNLVIRIVFGQSGIKEIGLSQTTFENQIATRTKVGW